MKKLSTVLALFLLLMVTSCDLLNKSEEGGLQAPDMGPISEIEITGVTRVPATEDEALELLLGGMESIEQQRPESEIYGYAYKPLNNPLSYINNQSRGIIKQETEPYEWIVGDSIVEKGSYEYTTWCDDDLEAMMNREILPKAGTYDPAMVYTSASKVTGTYKNASYNNYVVNGKKENSSKSKTSAVMVLEENGNFRNESMSVYYEILSGNAVSVVNSEGLGAKFKYSFAFSDSADISGDITGNQGTSTAFEKLGEAQVTFYVYDQNDNQIFEITRTLIDFGM